MSSLIDRLEGVLNSLAEQKGEVTVLREDVLEKINRSTGLDPKQISIQARSLKFLSMLADLQEEAEGLKESLRKNWPL